MSDLLLVFWFLNLSRSVCCAVLFSFYLHVGPLRVGGSDRFDLPFWQLSLLL
jgi:hypothetical protein